MIDADRFRQHLIQRLLFVAGLAAAACSTSVDDSSDGDSATSSTRASSGSGVHDSIECIDPNAAAGGAGGRGGAGGNGGALASGGHGGAGGALCPSPAEAEQLITVNCGGTVLGFDHVENGLCCYNVRTGDCVTGRPFTRDGAPLCAPARDSDAWAGRAEPNLSGLSKHAREQLAAAWTRDALGEHASIASFARFALELMALGAPPELIAAAHRAAGDEVRHARACFALASAYAGKSVGPGALPVGTTLELSNDLAEVAARAAYEGCVGETLAAMQACEQLAVATDPAVRAVLERIARDEARHAELAWQTVAWAMAEGGARVERAVSQALREGIARFVEPDAEGLSEDGAWWQAHGRLSRAEIVAARRAVVVRVIAPCAVRLAARLAA